MWKDEYMRLCFDSSTLDDISNGMLLKDQHIPKRLYRFRPFNRYTVDEVKYQYVRIVSPKTFNDLLDTRAKVDFRFKFYGDNAKLKKNYRQHLKEHIPREKLEYLLEKDNWFEEILKEVSIQTAKEQENESITPEYIQKTLKAVLDDEIITLNEQTGTLGHSIVRCCCFSETNNNLAMWNHYASQYSGFCIEYDMTKFNELDLQRRLMYPVIYTDELPDIMNQITNFQPKHVSLFTWVSLHKKMEWSYENEWRLIFSGIFREDIYIRFPAISAIYLGNGISGQNKSTILDVSRNAKIAVYEMQLKENEISFIAI